MLMTVYECQACQLPFAIGGDMLKASDIRCPAKNCGVEGAFVLHQLGVDDVHVPTQHEESIGG